MTDTLTVHFVDGSDAEVNIVLDEKRVEFSAFDEKTRKRYRLVFAECTLVRITYSDIEPEWADLNDLTEGIQELERLSNGVRRFQIGFDDESLLEIHCKNFSMMVAPNHEA